MSDLRDLADAFAVLEQRADAAPAAAPITRPVRHSRRMLAPLATAAAVVVAAGGIAIWQYSPSTSPAGAPAGSERPSSSAPVAPSSAAVAPSSVPPSSSTAPPSSSAATASPSGRYQPPTTVAELTAKTRAILGATATITVTGGSGQGDDPAASGSAIQGQLTSAGQTGGYLLNVFAASRGTVAACQSGDPCTIHHRADGSTLAVGSHRDSDGSGGITRQIEFVRADGADISMLLSTEADPKGQSAVTAGRVPLTVQQLTDFVTSPSW